MLKSTDNQNNLNPTFKQKPLTKELDSVFNKHIEINTETDKEFFLEKNNYKWEDLNILKEELGKNIIDFLSQVNSIITRQDIITNLGSRKEEFEKTVMTFFNDINEFSSKVKSLSEQHKNKSGNITNMDEFNIYNRLAIFYNVYTTELLELVTPTLSNLVLIVSEVISDIQNNISDAEIVKEVSKEKGKELQ